FNPAIPSGTQSGITYDAVPSAPTLGAPAVDATIVWPAPPAGLILPSRACASVGMKPLGFHPDPPEPPNANIDRWESIPLVSFRHAASKMRPKKSRFVTFDRGSREAPQMIG